MEPRPDGSGRQAEDVSGLLGAETEVVVEDDVGPMVDVETAESPIELVTVEEPPGFVSDRGIEGR
jgi:hypothetical protein